MLLMIDNYDSFTYNLVQYFGELEQDVHVYRNDKITIDEIKELSPSYIVISPGPCTPNEAGISIDVINNFKKEILTLILKQIEHLVKNFSNLERNSDLIRIIKALIYSSIYIPNKNYYYQIAIFNLKSELNKQILKDGCHFQRNPKIHIQVLMDLLDIRTILNSTKKNISFSSGTKCDCKFLYNSYKTIENDTLKPKCHQKVQLDT